MQVGRFMHTGRLSIVTLLRWLTSEYRLCMIIPKLDETIFFFFFLMIRRPPESTLFPYTTLSRSRVRRTSRREFSAPASTLRTSCSESPVKSIEDSPRCPDGSLSLRSWVSSELRPLTCRAAKKEIRESPRKAAVRTVRRAKAHQAPARSGRHLRGSALSRDAPRRDRKSTRLNSSHSQ